MENEKRRQSDLKHLSKKIDKYYSQAEQSLKQLSSTEFACSQDALQAAEKLSRHMTWHQLAEIQVIEKPHYTKLGKPPKGSLPERLTYQVKASIVPKKSELDAQRRRFGRFLLATNVLDAEQLPPDEALKQYMAQQGVERGFRFLKDPLFFASSVFLKSPKRVAALGLIMALCLLVYNLGQRQLRMALAQQQETIPNQLGKPSTSPTLRWVFQCFMAVHLVILNGVTPEVLCAFLDSACEPFNISASVYFSLFKSLTVAVQKHVQPGESPQKKPIALGIPATNPARP